MQMSHYLIEYVLISKTEIETLDIDMYKKCVKGIYRGDLGSHPNKKKTAHKVTVVTN